MPEEKKEKLEYLKREEVKTMIKDVSGLREKEAQKERERVAGFSPKREKPTEKKEPTTDIKEEESESFAVSKLPRKSWLTKKILIRVVIFLVFLSFWGVLVWFFFFRSII